MHSKIIFLEGGSDMSVSIEVEKGKPFKICDILPKVEKALKLVLGLTYDPKVLVEFVRNNGEKIDSQESAWIRPGMGDSFTVRLNGEQAEARIHSREGVDYFAVIPEKWWSAALGAAIAIAIAEHSESEVCDTGSTYTLKEYLKPDEFTQSIKVDKVFDDINEATKYFFSRLASTAKE
jgi:hypothetical protein